MEEGGGGGKAGGGRVREVVGNSEWGVESQTLGQRCKGRKRYIQRDGGMKGEEKRLRKDGENSYNPFRGR